MMDWTDRHCRAFHRALTAHALLYTEMVTEDAVIHGDRARLIGFSPLERPLALQLGGSTPAKLREASRIGAEHGFDEINLNVGCPSDRVQSGRFGACLMREPALVGACLAAMREGARDVEVTVKCRLGVDDQNPDEALFALVDAAERAGVTTVIVHARKAWLEGLSPKENREVPPLDYDIVRRLKKERPHLAVILNGGLADLEQARREAEGLDGVMLGRAAYQNPSILLDVDPLFFGAAAPSANAMEAVEKFIPYIEARLSEGAALHAMTRHMLGLFRGMRGGRAWRRLLSAQPPGAGIALLREAMAAIARPRELTLA
jgi:tRNA-dihydrouridine synthase A